MKKKISLLVIVVCSSSYAYRDMKTGTFLTRDPLGYRDGPNIYCYVNGNPITRFDPYGLLKRDANGKIITTPLGKPAPVKHGGASNTSFMVQPVLMETDSGTPVIGYVNQSGDSRMDTDCHGLTFADGTIWINNSEVTTILKGDGYSQNKSTPQVGDVVVYYENGQPVHTTTVTEVDPKTGEVTVSGLGGLETTARKSSVRDGWHNKKAEIKYYSKSSGAAQSTTTQAPSSTEASTPATTPKSEQPSPTTSTQQTQTEIEQSKTEAGKTEEKPEPEIITDDQNSSSD